jgi:hypothetical protein
MLPTTQAIKKPAKIRATLTVTCSSRWSLGAPLDRSLHGRPDVGRRRQEQLVSNPVPGHEIHAPNIQTDPEIVDGRMREISCCAWGVLQRSSGYRSRQFFNPRMPNDRLLS